MHMGLLHHPSTDAGQVTVAERPPLVSMAASVCLTNVPVAASKKNSASPTAGNIPGEGDGEAPKKRNPMMVSFAGSVAFHVKSLK